MTSQEEEIKRHFPLNMGTTPQTTQPLSYVSILTPVYSNINCC